MEENLILCAAADGGKSLPDSEDFAFLRDLGLIKTDGEIELEKA